MKDFNYEIVRSDRKTLGITVYRDGRVVVRAPRRTPAVEIERLVNEKAAWIVQKREALAALPPLPEPSRFVDGEEHLYLGRPYPVEIRADENEGVELAGGALQLRLKDPGNRTRKEKLLDQWYRQQAKRVFGERLAAVYPTAAQHGIPFPPMKIRLMKTRWGSCSSRGNINLNLRLVQTPPACIDYVIMHELAHLKVPNHSPSYYALLGQLMPEWRERRAELQRIPVR